MVKKLFPSLLTLLFCGAVQAAPVFYTNETAFQTAASIFTLEIESFEGSNQFGGPIIFPGFTVSSNPGATLETTTDQFPTDGTETLLVQATGTPPSVTFNFNQAINAFGIDVIDFGTAGPNDLTVTTDNGTQLLYSSFTSSVGNVQFAGVVDSVAFSTLTISFSDDNDFVIFDRAQGGPISEPGILSLFSIFVLGLAYVRRGRPFS